MIEALKPKIPMKMTQLVTGLPGTVELWKLRGKSIDICFSKPMCFCAKLDHY